MKIRFFAVAKDGTRTEITDLYWFEENGVHTLHDTSIDGTRVEIGVAVGTEDSGQRSSEEKANAMIDRIWEHAAHGTRREDIAMAFSAGASFPSWRAK